MLDAGASWGSDGGHFVGRRLPALFTTILLDNPTWQPRQAQCVLQVTQRFP